MDAETDADREEVRGWKSPNVWAAQDVFEANPVKQLLVPASIFPSISESSTGLCLTNSHGSWPAQLPGEPTVDGVLHAQLPLGLTAGSELRRASWSTGRFSRDDTTDVLDSYRMALSFNEQTEGVPGLRTPQLGAVHAVLGHWTTGRKVPATVVMPTCTGKTETMLALLVAARPRRLLVLVPSDALREQVAAKFERLGVLQEFGVVAATARRPIVGRVLHGFSAVNTTTAFADACNVIVATPSALKESDPAALIALLTSCSHLFVDEAHHVAAKTWSEIRDYFVDKDIVQFTATPFREDGKHLSGRTIYAFPLREAQAQGYFARINYTSVVSFENVDREVATQAVCRLREDLAVGHNHVLMVRVGGIPRAHALKPLYDELAADLNPAIINSRMSKASQKAALAALRAGETRVIICVSMLGEGFDLPALKVAAVHDPQKSLGVTLQFVGRFARTSTAGEYGDASVFVARREIQSDARLRALYAEDADWNVILRDLSETVVQEQQAVTDFEAGFTALPEEVTLRSLLPKMSTVVYRTDSRHWDPQNIVGFFGEENLLTMPIGLNEQAGVAWCVVEHREDVKWGDLKTIEEVTYELFVLYFDSERRLLYVNSSANSGVFEELVEAVAGADARRFTGSQVYRVMGDIRRLVPTTVGVVDAHSQFRRFSMHVGSDVTASFSQAEAGTKSQTNISGGGYRDGEYVNISASLKGRIWSHNVAPTLKHWVDWCDGVGTRLLDDTISIEQIIGQFILPEELDGRPESVLLAVEWPWAVRALRADNLSLTLGVNLFAMAYTDLAPDSTSSTGPFKFSVLTDAWSVPYEARVDNGRLIYTCTGDQELEVRTARTSRVLSEWLNEHGLLFILDQDRLIEGDLLYQANNPAEPYARGRLRSLDWTGIDLHLESQGPDKRASSIQHRAVAELLAGGDTWDVVLDDDGTGEIADIVALRIDDDELVVRLVHCKFSRGDSPGARVSDLYEVCGQAQKSVVWRKGDLQRFFAVLEDRARRKYDRTGVSPFEVGDARALYQLQERALVMRRRVEMVIVQPGLSASRASTVQLELLASTEAYLLQTINAQLTIWCSD